MTSGSAWSRQTPDFTEIITPTFDNITPVTLVKDGFLPVTLPASEPLPNTGSSVFYHKLPTQYAAQWFVDIQRELPQDMVWIVGYQGSSSSYLLYRFQHQFPGTSSNDPSP